MWASETYILSISHGSGPEGINKFMISESKLSGIPLVMFCCKTKFPSKSRINKSLWEALQAVHTSSSEPSTQTGESLLEVQLPEEDELAEPLDIPTNSTLCPWDFRFS